VAATTASVSTSSSSTNPSTWQLDRPIDPVAGIDLDREQTTEQIHQPLTQSEIDLFPKEALHSQVPSLDFNPHDRLAEPISEIDPAFDTDALELNEFMNLLSDDMPTEGTWMQDDEFFDREMSLTNLGDSNGDESSLPLSAQVLPAIDTDPMDDLAMAISQNNAGDLDRLDLGTYDEETFYTPDLGDEIDDRDIANFWSDTQLAASQHQPLYQDLDLLDLNARKIQPDLLPALDLVDVPAPDFSLDRPMSELFPTIVPPQAQAEIEPSDAISSEMVTPSGGDDPLNMSEVSDFNSDGGTSQLIVDEIAPVESPIKSTDFQPDLQAPIADRDDSSIDPAFGSQLDEFALDLTSDLRLEELGSSPTISARDEDIFSNIHRSPMSCYWKI
jgi:hypothetical protein